MADVRPADVELARGWLGAVARAEVCGALEGVYAATAAAVTARGPACWASGRCCNFEKTGHRLYVTGLEAAYTVARQQTGPVLTVEGLAVAMERGGCPFQEGNLCGVHPVRPLGCRVYFCDRTAQEWQQELYERELGALRGVHDRFGIEYRYGEWRELLGWFVG